MHNDDGEVAALNPTGSGFSATLRNRDFPRAFFVVPSPNAQPGPATDLVAAVNLSQPPSAELPSDAEISAVGPKKNDFDLPYNSSWANMIQRIESICALWFDQKPPDLAIDQPPSHLEERMEIPQ
jgi:hypothetical protein